MTSQELLALKQRIKRNIPRFIRENHGGLPRINDIWRKPKGIHSKLRHGFAGHRSRVEPGFGTPAALRGVNKNGLRQVLVNNLAALARVNPKEEGIILGSVGMKKKIALITAAQQKKITILTIKNVPTHLAALEQKLKQRKDAKKTKTQTKQEKTNTREKETAKITPSSAQQKTTEEPITDNTKKDQAKKELDKVLTKKDA